MPTLRSATVLGKHIAACQKLIGDKLVARWQLVSAPPNNDVDSGSKTTGISQLETAKLGGGGTHHAVGVLVAANTDIALVQ